MSLNTRKTYRKDVFMKNSEMLNKHAKTSVFTGGFRQH